MKKETAQSEQSWRAFAERIMTPEQLHQRVLTDDRWYESVVGCSTLSLSHIEQGISGRTLSILRYRDRMYASAKVNIDLVPRLNRHLFPSRQLLMGNGRDDVMKMIEDNASGNGGMWGVHECAWQQKIPQNRINNPHLPLDFLHWTIESFTQGGPCSPAQLDLWLNDRFTDRWQANAYADWKRYFGGITNVLRFSQAAGRHRGVQVVYTNAPEFISFLHRRVYQPVDDFAITVYGDIPDSFIGALVPLGPYEHEQMRK